MTDQKKWLKQFERVKGDLSGSIFKKGRRATRKYARGHLAVLLVVLVLALVSCGGDSTAAIPTPQPTTPPQATQSKPTPTLTPTPTKQAGYPVCSQNATNAPCVQYGSIQDAAVGESGVGADVQTSISKGVVSVLEDITHVSPPQTSLDAIQFQCFNIQQGLWYGLKSTINADGSQTVKKSSFAEVKIKFIDQHKGQTAFASCNLTSAGVDKIDQAGMWADGDYVGAWSMYASTSYK